MFLVIGAVIVFICVVGGFTWEGGHVVALVQPAEFLIIGGAAVGSMFISTPPKVFGLMLKQVKSLGKAPGKNEYLELLSMLYQIFRVMQQGGVMSLETHFDNPSNSPILSKFPGFLARTYAVDFLADSVKVVMAGGIAPHDLDALMDEDLDVHREEAIQPSVTLAKIADALPGLGIVAAVLGVVVTMGAIDGPPAEIGEKVGAALIGTFLGILMSYGFAQPLATKLEHSVNEDTHYLQCIKAGFFSACKGFPPAIAIEFARRSVSGDKRPSFDETEQACRTTIRQQDAVAAA